MPALNSCVFFPPLFTEYNLCDKMDAWGGKDEAYWWGQNPRTAHFYELNGIYYEEVPTVYKAVSKPIRIMEFKGHDEWPKETSRDLYTEVYYGALTPQQVKDYLGKDAAPLPTDTPMLLHERDFNKAVAASNGTDFPKVKSCASSAFVGGAFLCFYRVVP